MLNPLEIANAFNTLNEKKTWKARAVATSNIVHFDSGGLITLILRCEDGRFMVKFNKFQAAWGDYIGSICRGLYVVLNTLKASGLPFEAPHTPDGMAIEAVNSGVGNVYVRWIKPIETTNTNALGMLSTDTKTEYENKFKM